MTMTVSTRDEICSEIIRQYLFDNVWNEPESEYRINVHPQVLKDRSYVGSFTVLDANIVLPKAGESYFLWYMKSTDINLGLNLKAGVWYDLVTVCNEYRTLIHAYTESGCMLPKCSVFIRYSQSKSILYIAVKKRAYNLCTPSPKLEDLYLTFYYDSDVVNNITIYSTEVKTTREFTANLTAISNLLNTANSNDCILEFCNGIECTDVVNTPELNYGNFYDVIVDNNIIGSFEVDLTKNSECPVFLSDRDQVWKQIIHIPRDKNPDNYVITQISWTSANTETMDSWTPNAGTISGGIWTAPEGKTYNSVTFTATATTRMNVLTFGYTLGTANSVAEVIPTPTPEPEPEPDPTAVTFDFTSGTELTSWGLAIPANSSGTNVSEITNSVVTLSAKNAEGANPIRIWASNSGVLDLRAYKDDVLKISVPDNYIITQISWTSANTETMDSWTPNAGSISGGVWTAPEGKTYKSISFKAIL